MDYSSKYSDDNAEETSTSANDSVQSAKVNYREDLINLFYCSMLDLVVDEWVVNDQSEEKSDSKETQATSEKDYKRLTNSDLQGARVVSVKGSRVSYLKNSDSSLNKVSPPSIEIKKDSTLSTIETEENTLIWSRSNSTLKDNPTENGSAEDNSFEPNVTIYLKSGGIYKGPAYNKRMHGVGEFFWADGAYYKGDFLHGKITGKGTLILPEQSLYVGNFCDGWFHGEGTFQIANTPMLYSGFWKAGRKNGKGWLLYSQGNWYDGEWLDDMRHGVGLRQYEYGVRYSGSWQEGLRSGFGTMLYRNNDFYEGEWYNGLQDGFGKYEWKVDAHHHLFFTYYNSYNGFWEKGMRNGAGIMVLGNNKGQTLAGIWQHNFKHGPGVIRCGDGKIFEMNPLFIEDKPLNLGMQYINVVSNITSVSKLANDDASTTNNSTTVPTDIECHRDSLVKSVQRMSRNVDWKLTNTPTLNIYNVKNPSIEDNSVIDSFGNFLEGNPLEIPIFSPPENLNLSYIIHFVMTHCKGNCVKKTPSQTESNKERVVFGGPNKFLCVCKETNDYHMQMCKYIQDELFDNEKVIYRYEEQKLRNEIVANLKKLKYIYNYYGCINLPEDGQPPNVPIVIRLFLWQLYRDIGLVDWGWSINKLDLLVFENTDANLESQHNPFELIHPFQFSQIILTLSFYTCSYFKLMDSKEGDGVLATIFRYFVDTVVIPNVGKRKSLTDDIKPNAGKCLFELRDLLPLDSVYRLYQHYGEPHTVAQFLKYTCIKKGEEVRCYYKCYPEEDLPKIKNGINVAYFRNSRYMCDEETIPTKPKPQSKPNDDYFKHLYVFRHLGPKNIIKCVASVVPIIKDGVITKINYKLSFIDFYDIILACAHMLVEMKTKKLNFEKRRQEIRNLIEQGLFEPVKMSSPKKSKSIQKEGKDKK